MAKIYHHSDQITVWDILGVAPWEMKAPARELPPIAASQPTPAPDAFTPEELAEVENFVAHGQTYGPAGDEAGKRWDAWVTAGRAVEKDRLRREGFAVSADIQVLETRLGWAALILYAEDADVDARDRHGNLTRPEGDRVRQFFWRTRDAAIAHCAHVIWNRFNEDDGSTGRKLKRRIASADRARAFFKACGIEAVSPPSPSLRRVLVTAERERQLKARAVPDPAPEAPGVEPALMARFEGVIDLPSPLTLKRRERQRERATVAAAKEAQPLSLTMNMGSFKDAHGHDRCEPGPDGYVVTVPPFHFHDETHVEPVDELLGQVVGVEPARVLLFRRRDPDILDGCEVGQRYVLLRFWDDEDGQVWSMPVQGDDDDAVRLGIRRTVALYRGDRRATA